MVISIDAAIKTEVETSLGAEIKELTLGSGHQSMDMKPQIFCPNVFFLREVCLDKILGTN